MKHLDLIRDSDGELWVEHQGTWLCVTDDWLLNRVAARTHQAWSPVQVDKQYGPACRVRLVRRSDVVCQPCRDQNHDICIKANGQSSTWCDCQHDKPQQPSLGAAK